MMISILFHVFKIFIIKIMAIKNKLFPLLIALSALSVSASAAFYSISGLSKLFAGASLEVIIMASSLEIAKLVIASLLYQYWDTLNKTLRVYLTIATTVLILITSMGIYGFLSSAYQETANKDNVVTQQITTLETKKGLYIQTRDNLLKEKQSLNELRGTLSKGATTQFTDKKGNLVVRSNKANIKQMESTSKSDDKLTARLDVANDSIFALENRILEVKTGGATSELGPLKYLSGLTGLPMDKIINYLLLVIIFVFDPLAIALVIAANFAFAQLKIKEEDKIEEKNKQIPVFVDPETGDLYYDIEDKISNDKEQDEFKDWDVTLTDGLENISSEFELIDEDKQYDADGDGKLNEAELLAKRADEDRLLNNQSISRWRKNKILNSRNDGEIKTY
jgi:hypothetical protein